MLPDRDARVIDLGSTGMLLRTVGVLRPGRSIRFQLRRDQGDVCTLSGDVRWCLVVGIEPEQGVIVHAGVAFTPPLDWWRDLDSG